ncbi:hypothetical protein L218DRAFT_959948 [Marasmius fiardii PR-910]|nr:hypothetical protein L218DRAFT_959948 [Marasmius fiardii PR-910]
MGDIDKRAQTLQALSEYITAQKLLLSKTRGDIERLNGLRNRVIEKPSGFVGNLSEELNDSGFRLSEQVKLFSEIRKPKDIDWTVYEKYDPTPLRRSFTNLASESQALRVLPPPTLPLHPLLPPLPPTLPSSTPLPLSSSSPLPFHPTPMQPLTPCSANTDTHTRTTPPPPPPHLDPHPHPLREYVKNARTTILDPVFTKWNLSYHPEPEPELTTDSDRNRETGGTKSKMKAIRDLKNLKKRKVVCGGLTVSPCRGGVGGGSGTGGVFVRRDVGDESMDVDVDVGDGVSNPDGSLAFDLEERNRVGEMVVAGSGRQWNFSKSKAKAKTRPKPVPPRRGQRRMVPPPLPPPMVLTKSPRARRPSMKASSGHEEGEVREKEEEKDKPQLQSTTRPKGPTIVIPALSHPRRMRIASTSTSTEASSSVTPPVFYDARSRSRSLSCSQSCSRSRFSSSAPFSPVTSPEPEVVVEEEEVEENADDDDDDDGMDTDTVVAGEDEDYPIEMDVGGGKRKKPKPETYKQAWSVSEQHLLERLLDEIPDGSKNRWKQISLGMGGKRTPRQVASRVQKYFEKLRKYDALDVDGV